MQSRFLDSSAVVCIRSTSTGRPQGAMTLICISAGGVVTLPPDDDTDEPEPPNTAIQMAAAAAEFVENQVKW